MQQRHLLRDHTEGRRQTLPRYAVNTLPVDTDRSTLRLCLPLEQAEQGGLSRPRWSGNTQPLHGRYMQVEVLEQHGCDILREGHAVELGRPTAGPQAWRRPGLDD